MIASIKYSWSIFKRLVIPAKAPEIQVASMHAAFYAGALVGARIVHNSTIEAALIELDEFGKDLPGDLKKAGESIH